MGQISTLGKLAPLSTVGSGLSQNRSQAVHVDSVAMSTETQPNEKKAGNSTTGHQSGVDLEALSYILGVSVAQNMHEQKLPLQTDE